MRERVEVLRAQRPERLPVDACRGRELDRAVDAVESERGTRGQGDAAAQADEHRGRAPESTREWSIGDGRKAWYGRIEGGQCRDQVGGSAGARRDPGDRGDPPQLLER
jgi:hypothetical protein